MIARKLPSRKLLRQSLNYYVKQGCKRTTAIATIAKARSLLVEDVERILSEQVQPGRKRKEVTVKPRPADKIGTCTECGQEKLLARRKLQLVCVDCVRARKPDPNYEHTPEEFERLKAEAREASKNKQRNMNRPKLTPARVEIMVVEQLGVLNGRAGSWSLYE